MIRLLLVTAGGLGLLRPAPGSWGSLPPAALAWLLLLAGVSPLIYNVSLIALGVLGAASCLAFGAWAEKRFGKKDPGQVVADEVAGMAITLLFLPQADPRLIGGDFWRVSLTIAAAYILFRALDTLKPPPAHAIQRLPAGQGVLYDDLIAGVYSLIALQGGLWLMRQF